MKLPKKGLENRGFQKTERFDRYVLSIIVLGIVAIVAMVSLLFYSNFGQGAATYKEQTEEMNYPCVDDDPNNDFYLGGTATFGRVIYEDYCMDGYLHQYHCATSNTIRTTPPYECPNGCLNGACLSS